MNIIQASELVAFFTIIGVIIGVLIAAALLYLAAAIVDIENRTYLKALGAEIAGLVAYSIVSMLLLISTNAPQAGLAHEFAPSLRAQRGNPNGSAETNVGWIATSLRSSR